MFEVDEPALGAGTPGIGAIVVVVAGTVLVVLVDVVLVVELLVGLFAIVVEDPTVVDVAAGTLETVLVDEAVISTLETGSKRHSVASSPSGMQAASARAARTTYRIFIVLCYQ